MSGEKRSMPSDGLDGANSRAAKSPRVETHPSPPPGEEIDWRALAAETARERRDEATGRLGSTSATATAAQRDGPPETESIRPSDAITPSNGVAAGAANGDAREWANKEDLDAHRASRAQRQGQASALNGEEHGTAQATPLDSNSSSDLPRRSSIPPQPSQAIPTTNDPPSSSSTPNNPPPRLPPYRGKVPRFTSTATLILVGIRGCGKSTLGIMAASALRYLLIDMDSEFRARTGMTVTEYRKHYTAAHTGKVKTDCLEQVLEKHGEMAVIICPWMEAPVQGLLRGLCGKCPVVHVGRDLDALQRHIGIEEREKMESLVMVSNSMLRSCTNYEFFNISELQNSKPSSPVEGGQAASKRLPSPHLTLKGAERHFFKFLSQIYPEGTLPDFDAGNLLSAIPLTERLYTYALSVTLSESLAEGFDIEDHTTGADAVQLVVPVDLGLTMQNRPGTSTEPASDITFAVARIRRCSALPIIVHVALPDKPTSDQVATYLGLISHCLRSAPHMITLDLHIADSDLSSLTDQRGRAVAIAEYSFKSGSSPPWDSEFWVAQYLRAVALTADVVRFLRPACSLVSSLKVSILRAAVSVQRGRRIPLIAYNEGASGRHSAAFNPLLTIVRPSEETNSSTRLSAHAATLALTSAFVYDPMKLWVFGANVDYSMSPAMHNAALQALGMPHHYAPHSVASLSSLDSYLQDPNFGGASVGLPFKVEIMRLTNSVSQHAQAIGACNTVIPIRELDNTGNIPGGALFINNINRAGRVKALYGENTDWIGIQACIRRGLSPANAVRSETCGVVIGAGGMARAAIYAMLKVGIQNIAIYNRSHANAQACVHHFQDLLSRARYSHLGGGEKTRFMILDYEDWEPSEPPPTIIISSIPTHAIGDTPAPDFRVPDSWLRSKTGGVILELGYKTLQTPLLKQARDRAAQGWVAMDGLDLLPDQGFAQFELFTGRRAPRRIMRRDLLKVYIEQHGESDGLLARLRAITEPEA